VRTREKQQTHRFIAPSCDTLTYSLLDNLTINEYPRAHGNS
jgi:hypothetical protein